MKISELIALLEQRKEEYDDLQTYYWDDNFKQRVEITDVNVYSEGGKAYIEID